MTRSSEQIERATTKDLRGASLEDLQPADLAALRAYDLRRLEREAGRRRRRHARRTHGAITSTGRNRRAIDQAIAYGVLEAWLADLAGQLETYDGAWRNRDRPPSKLGHAIKLSQIDTARERATVRVRRETGGAAFAPTLPKKEAHLGDR